MPERYNTLRESPAGAKYKLCVVQFKVPGAKNGGSDKGPDGNRVDSIPIANSVIAAGGARHLILSVLQKLSNLRASEFFAKNYMFMSTRPFICLVMKQIMGERVVCIRT